MKVREQGRADWWVAPVDGGSAVSTGASSLPRIDFVQLPTAWVGRHVLVAAGATMEGVNIHRVRISPGDWKVSGPAEPLTSGTGVSYMASVAADGRMAIPRFNWLVQLWAIEVGAGGVPASTAPQALTHDAAPKFGFSLARDAPRMAYTAYAGSRGRHRIEVRLRDLASGGETTPIQTSARSITLNPHLSADGALVSWEDEVDGHWASFVGKAGDSSGREVCRDCGLLGFFSDSRHVLSDSGPRRLVRRNVEGGAETPLLELETGTIIDADLSWDDRWLAVTIGRSDGTIALQVVPAGERAASPTEGIPVAASEPGLASPRWSPDGSRLYYLANRDGFVCLWAQALDPATKRPRGEPAAVFHAHRNPWRMNLPRGGFSFRVGRDRIVFNAAEITGNVLMGKLPPD